MYKLEKHSPFNNVVHNVKTYFPTTLWSGRTHLVSLTLGSVLMATIHHPSLQATFEGVVGGANCLFITTTLGTLAWTIKNFKTESKRWIELGKKLEEKKQKEERQEQQALSQFTTPSQQIMKEFTHEDKIVPLNLFMNSADENPQGGRQEEIGFSKILKFPGR